MNAKNLKSIKTHEEAVEKGSKGGTASGKSRGRKKLMSEQLKEIMHEPVADTRTRRLLEKEGFEPTYGAWSSAALSAKLGGTRTWPGSCLS